MGRTAIAILCSLACTCSMWCQQETEGTKLTYRQIYAYGMDANLPPALELVREHAVVDEKDVEFKERFLKRFGKANDESMYASSGNDEIDELLGYFRAYWRMSMLDPEGDYMMELGRKVMPFLSKNYPIFKGPQQRDSLGNFLADFIRSKGLHTTSQINPQGRLVDMMIWKDQKDTLYHVKLSKVEDVDVQVVMLDDFVTLGWMEYATLGAHHPGGWTTEEAIFCVRKAYDFSTEDFLVSLLAHEARHFADKQVFENLSDQQLEYRAKLTELSRAKETAYNLIGFFTQNANSKSENGHQLANYEVIRNFSEHFFNTEFQNAPEEWKKIPVKKINRYASKLLAKNTLALRQSNTKPDALLSERP
ncbi:hypothetical protein [Flagellimonas meishanensis]|uniref:hypothetical protein n=1 Tax=Flagellimonas meishanensis TaxID=2873264 RepID=UPI001CA68FA9|nr:hypothetical protein [[Muricauda] meishanensis]